MSDEQRPAVDTLTKKQRLWLECYLQSWNATDAARRAKYASPNKQGPALLKKVAIRAAIEERLAEAAMSADEVLARLSQQARGSMLDFLDFPDEVDGEPTLDLWLARQRGALGLIKEYTRTEARAEGENWDQITVTHKIKLHDAQSALVHLGRHHRLFTDVQENKGEILVKGYTVDASPDDWDDNESGDSTE